MGLLLRVVFALVLVGAFAVIAWRLLHDLGLVPSLRRSHKCEDCAHNRGIYPDGVICGFGAREVFKNDVHVANCVDHRRRARGA
jgi:hypothetical protein